MGWGKGHVRRAAPSRRWWTAVVAAIGLVGGVAPLVTGAEPAAATVLVSGCSGFAACSVGGHTTHGYQYHMGSSWWRMYAGTNCTNYAAFVEATAFHAPTPGYLLGNAEDWPANAAAHGARVDHTPSVGAVAVWYGGAPGIPFPGHVGIVEQVAPGSSEIVISQDNIGSDTDGYDWTRLTEGGVGSNGWQSWPNVFIHFATTAPATAPSPGSTEGPPPATSLVRNGNFAATAGWSRGPASSFVTAASVAGTRPWSGSRFAAVSTTSGAGGFYQDVSLRTSAGQRVCADAEVVTVGRAWNARGELALWLLGGSAEESAAAAFAGLPGGNRWTPISVCVTATRPHTVLRVQVYDAPGTPMLGVDAVDAHLSLAGGSWRAWPGSTLAQSAHLVTSRTTTAGGGFYQDVRLAVRAGDSFCANARVVSAGVRPGVRGNLVLWLLGGAHTEKSSVAFGPLRATGHFVSVATCVSAGIPHSDLRVQFYVTPGTGTLAAEAVDVHRSLAADAGFDTAAGGGAWRLAPRSNFATYLGTGHATLPFEGTGFGVTNTASPGGGVYQDRHYAVAAGTSLCADAAVVTAGAAGGARGELVIWLLGNGRSQAAAAPFGPLPGGSAWQRIGACITADAPASDVRIQVYPAPGAPNLGVDAVDLR